MDLNLEAFTKLIPVPVRRSVFFRLFWKKREYLIISLFKVIRANYEVVG